MISAADVWKDTSRLTRAMGAYRESKAGPDEGNSALVEFSLTEEAHGTRLRVVESGIDAVTHDDEGKARYLESHEHGWEKHLGELLDYVASKPHEATR